MNVHLMFGVGASLAFAAWFAFPLKRFVGHLGHPPNHQLTRALRHGYFREELQQALTNVNANAVEHAVILFFTYLLVPFLYSFAIGGAAYLAATALGAAAPLSFTREVMGGTLLFGLFITSIARIAAIQFSTYILKFVFGATVAILSFGTYLVVSQNSVLTLVTDNALKAAYADYFIDGLMFAAVTYAATEIILDLSGGILPMTSVVPMELFYGLRNLYHERETVFGQREVQRVAVEMLKASSKARGLRSLHWITVDYEPVFLDAVRVMLEANPAIERVITIIAPNPIAERIKECLGEHAEVFTVDNSGTISYERCVIVNREVGILYHRIPPGQGGSANIAQVLGTYTEVHSIVGAVEALAYKLKSER